MKGLLRVYIRVLIIAILLSGLPVDVAGMSESSFAPQQKKSQKKSQSKSRKKKSSKKKSSPKRQPSSKKKRTRAKKKRSRPTSRKKVATKRKPSRKKATPRKITRKRKAAPSRRKAPAKPAKAERPPVKRQSVYELSDEIFRLTYELDAGMHRLEKAQLSLKPFIRPSIQPSPVERIEIIEEKARKNPNDPFTQRELALEYERKGMFSKAKDIYLRMIASDPMNADYHYYLGSLFSRSGHHRDARLFYGEALEIDPNHAATIAALSTYGKGVEGEKMASDLYDKAAKKQPEGPADLINKINRNLNNGSYDEAISLCTEGITKYAENYIFPYLLGQAYEANGNAEEAKKAYKKSMRMDRTDISAATALANLYFDQGNYLYAAITFENILPIKPLDMDIRFRHGLSYFRAHDWAKAASAWEDLLHYAPNHPQARQMLPQAYYVLSLEYNRTGYTDLGRKAFANALSVNPNSNDWLADALRTAGEYYREHGLYRDALNSYQDAIEINPTDAESYNGLGATYWAMSESGMAVAAWKKSLSLQPENNSAKGWLLLAKRHPG